MTNIKEIVRNKLLKELLPNGFYFIKDGFCPCCDKNVTFLARESWLRDSFLCNNCHSIPRERAIMLIIEKYFQNWRDLDIHESSPVWRGASLKLKKNAKKYITSQYMPQYKFGEMINNIQNEDLEDQSFNDESFDIVLTQDVFEHLYNPGKAFNEIARTLKKGGAHIFTVPLINKNKASEIWATKSENNNPIFIHTPEWHGNPIDSIGSPVTMHWGFDIVNFIKKNSGLETIIENIDDLDYGIRAEYIEVLITKKS